eukprot:m.83310 g.83310  ORF g.83310 m.83310 type:complete len:797 (+) comp12915_c0_seq1:95-2485(+)
MESISLFLLWISLCCVCSLGAPPPPPAPPTCSPGTPESSLPFCDRSLGFEARAADLANRLNITDHVNFFFSYPGTPYIQKYNIKSWSLDHTCIHGLNKDRGVTVFPHAIAQGASWDLDLVQRVSNATAVEARVLSWQEYTSSHGMHAGSALSCDGGPLANSAHDPRWGRISETYGEDPLHIQTIGVTVMNAIQNPQPVPGGKPEDRFLATRQVTRHYLGYHGGSGDTINGTSYLAEYNATNRSLADSYFPTYGAFQNPKVGAADGIMCAMTELNGVPSCANPLLMTTMLRNQWSSDAIIQTDCCDSVSTIASMKYKNLSPSEALALAVNDGLGIYFGFRVGSMRQYMQDNLGNGTIKEETIRAAGQRVLLSFFRLGFFDSYAKDYPFHNDSIPWSSLNSATHRKLSREATAKSTVLLKNDGILPLSSKTTAKYAVIGPFARCIETDQKTQNGTCYLHSYNGYPTNITSIYDGIAAAVPPGSVQFELGSNATCGWRCGDFTKKPSSPCWESGDGQNAISAAVALAKTVDVTVLALGAGAQVEAEGCDRFNLTLPAVQQVLLQEVSAVAKKLVIVLVSAGGLDVDETKANAVVWAPYGGEEAGSGLADVLFGIVNPSARLPVTFYKQAWFDGMTNNLTTSMLNLNLEVGLGRTYRYLKDPALVKHYFGAGLSFTTFSYSGLSTVKNGNGGLNISVQVHNTGKMDGCEVIQAYLTGAEEPNLVTASLSLVAFSKICLGAQGGPQTVSLVVSEDRFETAMNDGSMKIIPGERTVYVGGHHPEDVEGQATSGPCLKTTIQL